MTELLETDFRLVGSYPCVGKKSISFEPFGTSIRCRMALGDITSVNVDLDVAVGNGWTRITLREVPSFLFDAFQKILSHGLSIDGIFRKEGSSARLNRPEVPDVFRGYRPIPEDFTIVDICTMIKRFLRDIKPTLINSQDVRTNLLKYAERCRQINDFQLTHAEIDGIFKSNPLTPPHIGTIAYIARMLSRISQSSDVHKMTVENLSVVLVGSIFGDFMSSGGTVSRKKNPTSIRCTDKELASKREDMQVHVDAVKLLIVNANMIALPTEHYVSSNSQAEPQCCTRSTSAMPNMSSTDKDSLFDALCGNESPLKNNMVTSVAQRALIRRDSDLTCSFISTFRQKEEMGGTLTKSKKRSSSFLPLTTFRGFREKVSNHILRRNKSPSPARIFKTDTLPKRTRNQPSTSESRCDSIGSTSSGRQSRSLQARKGTVNSARNINFSSPGVKKSPSNSSTSTVTSRSFRRVSQSEQNSLKTSKNRDLAKSCAENASVNVLNNNCNTNNHKETSMTKRKKRPVSDQTKRKNVSRRNTVTLGSIICKQGRNKIGVSPPRRATCWDVKTIKEEEKENILERFKSACLLEQNMCNTMGDNEDEKEVEEMVEQCESPTTILETRDRLLRQRRDNAKKKKVQKLANSESLVVLNGSMSLFEKSPEDTKEPENMDVKWREKTRNIESQSVMKNRLQKIILTPNKLLDDDDSVILTPKLSRAQMRSPRFTLATTSSGSRGQKLDMDLGMAGESKPFDTPRINRKPAHRTDEPSPVIPQSRTVLPAKKMDSFGIKKHENGHVWVGERYTVVETPTPKPKRSISEQNRALSAAPNLGCMRGRAMSPSYEKKTSLMKRPGLTSPIFSSPMRDATTPTPLSPKFVSHSPVLRKAFESQCRLAASKTMSPLVVRSKSHLCESEVGSAAYIDSFATPPRVRRAHTPPKPSSLVSTTPLVTRRPLGSSLSTSSRPVLSSSPSLASIRPLKLPTDYSSITPTHSRKIDVVNNDEKGVEVCDADDDDDDEIFKCPLLPSMRVDTSRRHRKTKSNDFEMEKVVNKKDGVRHSSSSAVEGEMLRNESSSRMSYDGGSDSEFGFGNYTEAVRNATDESNLPTRHQILESRPSVVQIRSSKYGFVRSRINQFQIMENNMKAASNEPSSGRTSAFSQSSSRSIETASSLDAAQNE